MRILVTGSSGYIARFLMPRLVSQGHALVGLDRLASQTGSLERFIQGDLLDPDRLEQSLQDVECVVHLAAAKADWGLSGVRPDFLGKRKWRNLPVTNNFSETRDRRITP